MTAAVCNHVAYIAPESCRTSGQSEDDAREAANDAFGVLTRAEADRLLAEQRERDWQEIRRKHAADRARILRERRRSR